MRYIYFRVTNTCNIRCPHCYIPEFKGIMSDNVIDAFIDKYKKYNNNIIIMFHGGEPMLIGPNRLKRIIQKLEDNGFSSYVIQTNLSYELTDEIMDLFKEKFALGIGTSLDYSGKSLEGRNRDVIYRNIERLLNEGVRVRVNMAITKEYIESGEFEKDLDFIVRNNLLFRLEPYVYVPGKDLTINYYEFLKLRDRLAKEYADLYDDDSCGENTSYVQGGNCAANGLRVVDCDGEVYICPNFAGYKELSIGNVKDEDFDDTAKNKRVGMQVFYKRKLSLLSDGSSCGGCMAYGNCNSGCVANDIFKNYYENGKINIEKIEKNNFKLKDIHCLGIKQYYAGDYIGVGTWGK